MVTDCKLGDAVVICAADDQTLSYVGPEPITPWPAPSRAWLRRAGRAESAADAGRWIVQVGLGLSGLFDVGGARASRRQRAGLDVDAAGQQIASPARLPASSRVATPARLTPIALAAALQVWVLGSNTSAVFRVVATMLAVAVARTNSRSSC